MLVQQHDGNTMAAQVEALGYQSISFRSSLLLGFAQIVHTGETHAIKTAPAGKGTSATVAVHEQFLAWETNPDGTAKSGNFGSPRAVNVVTSDYEEVPTTRGVWRKKSISKGFLVPENAELRLLNREGVEQLARPGDVISSDRDGYCHVITREKFEAAFQIVGE